MLRTNGGSQRDRATRTAASRRSGPTRSRSRGSRMEVLQGPCGRWHPQAMASRRRPTPDIGSSTRHAEAAVKNAIHNRNRTREGGVGIRPAGSAAIGGGMGVLTCGLTRGRSAANAVSPLQRQVRRPVLRTPITVLERPEPSGDSEPDVRVRVPVLGAVVAVPVADDALVD